MTASPVLLAIALLAISGVPGLFFGRQSAWGERLAAALVGMGSLLGIFAALQGSAGETCTWIFPGGDFAWSIDGLSTLFLLPILLITLLSSVYGLSYWSQAENPDNGQKLRFFFGVMAAGMALLVIADTAQVFLLGWELMALSAFFLVTTESRKEEVRAAGWLYLVATHMATLALFGLFALLRRLRGTYRIVDSAQVAEAADTLDPALAAAILVAALLGFGIKAGLMPLHVWLPSAHAMAPSHISAMMSGVLIKMGIYGLVRVTSLFAHPPLWWGGLLLGLGVVSAVLGVAFAIGQHDMKRLLAYHSIENIGIIVMGLGVALIGRSLRRDDLVVLGLCGALLHTWNHALFKSLLFLSAGAVIHATHTREIDRLGGLAKTMRLTFFCFLVGAVAICGLPPLNGFISEFFVYLGLFKHVHTGDGMLGTGVAMAVPALALTGTLALACFVKVVCTVFLGVGRSTHVEHAHDPDWKMTGPMFVLVACCMFIGLLPALVAPLLERGVRVWAPPTNLENDSLVALASLAWISVLGWILTALLAVTGAVLWLRLRAGDVARSGTWGCGYAGGSASIQYTASSFAQMLVGLFGWALRPRTQTPPPMPLFPEPAHFHSEVKDPVLDEVIAPSFRGIGWLPSSMRWLQRGGVQSYLFYIMLTVVLLLAWSFRG
jgi:hydrogenase-4 component B